MGMNIVFLTGGSRDCLGAEPGDRRFMALKVPVHVPAQREILIRQASALTKSHASAHPLAMLLAHHATPPIGTPGAAAHGGNSTPARAPVAGVWKSPVFGPKAGE